MRLLRDEQREDERQGRGCDPEDDRRVEGVEDDDVLPGLRLQTPRMERHHGEILPGVGLQVERRSQHRIVVVGAVDDERTVFVGRNGEKRFAVELDLARRLPESRVHGERRLGIHADLRPVGQHDVEPLAARRAVFQGLCGADLRPGPGFGRDIGGALPEPHGANARRNHGGRRHIAQEPTPAPSGDLGDSEQDLVAGCETRPFPLRLGRRGQLPSGETLPEISPVFIRLLQPSRQHTGLLLTQSVAPVRIDQSVYLFLHIIYTKQIFSLCLHPIDTPFPDTDPRRAIFFSERPFPPPRKPEIPGPKLRGFFRSRQTGRAPQKRLRLVRAVVKIGFYAKFAVSCRKLETMTQQLRFIPFKSRSDKGWAEAWALYEASFPDCERWDGTGYDRAFGDPHFEADGIWRGDEFIGILFHWNAGDYRYVEHLAVSPRLRGQNMGSKALAAFCQGRRVILEIDPPEDEISVRRQHFYQRLGFVANPYAYIHPSFRRPFHPHRLVLMSYPEALTYEEARGFADFIREQVLRYSEHENPELPRL